MRLHCERVSYAYDPTDEVLRGVSFTVDEGEVVFVLGANGSGKTTLLQCLAGIRAPRSGRILLGSDDLRRLSTRERAQRVGLVPQIHEPVFSYSVGEVVMMGRAPHLGLFARPGRRDEEVVGWALAAVGIETLQDRRFTRTSGGEQQLALIARGLAQGADCLLMDEPAAHLDPHHQRAVFDAVARLAADGLSFIITSHQPNNALLYGDRAVFLVDGAAGAQGPPAQVVTEETLEAAYGIPFEALRGPDGVRAILPRVRRKISEETTGSPEA
jgi:iron complex transport system ATP-binding protein